MQAEIEEQVRRKTAELEQVHRSLLASEKMASIGKLAATVAHEINNPLFGILTYARLVTRKEVRKRARRIARRDGGSSCSTIERESKRCGEMVQQSADVLAAGAQPPRAQRSEHAHRPRRGAGAAQAGNAEDRVASDLAKDLPPVICDAKQIQQVVLVLLVNATEAMPHGGRLEVATELDAAAGHVADPGDGHRVGAFRPRCCRRSSILSLRPRRIRTAPAWGWPWRAALWNSMAARSRSSPRPAQAPSSR